MKPVTTATLLAPTTLVGVSRPSMITRPTCRVTRAVCCAALMLLSGCFTTGPADNLGFADIEQLSDLDGVYQNMGEPVSMGILLSHLIWPDVEGLYHTRIDRIEVRAVDADTLEVTGQDSSERVVQRGIFVEGKDFKISGGTIQLSRKIQAPPDAESATHFLGVAYEDVDLGLDEAGHGKYRSGGVAGGLVLMFIPIVVGGSDEVRFNRIDE
jgi:hypothetical protein